MFFKRISLLSLVTLLMLGACKKDESEVIEIPDTRALDARRVLVQHNWDFDLFAHQETVNGATTFDSIKGVTGDYFDFRTDGKVYGFWDSLADTVNYKLLDVNLLEYSGDAFVIETLTNSSFVFSIERNTDSTAAKDRIELSR